MVERRRSSSGRNVRVQKCVPEAAPQLALVAEDGETGRVRGKKLGRSRSGGRRQPVVERQSQEQDAVHVMAMEDKNLEHRKRTMLELFGDDTLPESNIEEVDDTSLECETTSIERKGVGEAGCSTCGDIGVEQELIRCQGWSNRWQHRYCDVSSEDSSRPQAAGEWVGAQQQSQQQQLQPPVKRGRLDLHGKPESKPPDVLASKCSGMNGLDLLLEVARSVSECGGSQPQPAGLSPHFSREVAPANTPGVSSASTHSPRKRGLISLPGDTVSGNRVGAASALARTPTHPQASRSSPSTVSGQKHKAVLVMETSTSTSPAEKWPSSVDKGDALNSGFCAEAPAMVPWERMKAGNRRYRLLSSMLC